MPAPRRQGFGDIRSGRCPTLRSSRYLHGMFTKRALASPGIQTTVFVPPSVHSKTESAIVHVLAGIRRSDLQSSPLNLLLHPLAHTQPVPARHLTHLSGLQLSPHSSSRHPLLSHRRLRLTLDAALPVILTNSLSSTHFFSLDNINHGHRGDQQHLCGAQPRLL